MITTFILNFLLVAVSSLATLLPTTVNGIGNNLVSALSWFLYYLHLSDSFLPTVQLVWEFWVILTVESAIIIFNTAVFTWKRIRG